MLKNITYKVVVYVLFTIAVALFLSTPLPTNAQETDSSFVTCSGAECQPCHLVQMANNIIEFLIIVLTVVAALIFAYAGFILTTSGGDTTARDRAKTIFTNVLIGYIIVLSAWLLIDTGMKVLLNEQEVGPWNEIECKTQPTLQERDISWDDSDWMGDLEDESSLPEGDDGTNCGVDESLLVDIPGQDGHRATAAVARHFVSMRNSLEQRGISLSVTSSYRSDARQTEIWDGCPRCQREGTVARPCSRGGGGSRHSSGEALDLVSSGSDDDIISACRATGAGFTMTYQNSSHVHCDWR